MGRNRFYCAAIPLFMVIMVVGLCARSAPGALYGVTWDTGNLYTINPATAAPTLVGATGITRIDDMAFGPDGNLYATTNSSSNAGGSRLFRINPATAAPTLIGAMGVTQFEGALAFRSTGVAYGAGQNATDLYTINLGTGVATVIGTMAGRDVSGWLFRSDGTLIAMEGTTGSNLYSINLTTFATTNIAPIPTIGGIGGMTMMGTTAYLATGLREGGTNSLYTFNPFTGATSLVGSFGLSGDGVSGLAAPIPEPATATLLATIGSALGGLFARRRRHA